MNFFFLYSWKTWRGWLDKARLYRGRLLFSLVIMIMGYQILMPLTLQEWSAQAAGSVYSGLQIEGGNTVFYKEGANSIQVKFSYTHDASANCNLSPRVTLSKGTLRVDSEMITTSTVSPPFLADTSIGSQTRTLTLSFDSSQMADFTGPGAISVSGARSSGDTDCRVEKALNITNLGTREASLSIATKVNSSIPGGTVATGLGGGVQVQISPATPPFDGSNSIHMLTGTDSKTLSGLELPGGGSHSITLTATPQNPDFEPQTQSLTLNPGDNSVTFVWDDLGEAQEPEVEEADPVDPAGTGSQNNPMADDFCGVAEVMDNLGPLRWLIAPLIEMGCSVLDINSAVMFPLLDVNIPLARSEDDVQLRKMFTFDAVANSSSLPSDGITTGILEFIYADTLTPPAIYNMWLVARDMAYTLIVLGMVIYSFFIMYQYDTSKYTANKMLTSMILSIALTAFSYQICTFLFDINRILALIAKDTMAQVMADNNVATASEPASAMATGVWTAISVGGLAAAGFAASASVPCALSLIIPFCGCLFTYMTMLIFMGVVLITRMIFLYAMVIVSPIVMMVGFIPEFSALRMQWLRVFINVLTMYPLAVLVFYLIQTIMAIF